QERAEKEAQERAEKEAQEKAEEERLEKERLKQEATRKILEAEERSKRYITTASFEVDGEAPEGWCLAPFVDRVMKIVGDDIAYEGNEGKESLFKTKVNTINLRVKTAFGSISNIVAAGSEEHSYLADSQIADKIKAVIQDDLTIDGEILSKDSEDVTDEKGNVTDGATTKRIRENLKSLTEGMDKKMESFMTAALYHQPQLELCAENIEKSPQLLEIIFNEEITEPEEMYYEAKGYLKQAIRNIEILSKAVDSDKDVVGDIPFLKKLIEKYGNNLLTVKEDVVQNTAAKNILNIKKLYKNGTENKKLLSQKITEKFGNDPFFKVELRLCISRLDPVDVTEEKIDSLIAKLLVNKDRNQKEIQDNQDKCIPLFVKEEDKHFYYSELKRSLEKYLPLDQGKFSERLAKASNRLANTEVSEIDGSKEKKPQVIIETEEEKEEKLTEEEKSKREKEEKEREELKKKQEFSEKHKAAITAMAGDYSEKLLYGFGSGALRLNNDKGEATSGRDLRMRDASGMKAAFDKGIKAAPSADAKGKKPEDKRSIVEKGGAPASIIEFVSYFKAAFIAS
ncbi:MAG: hypothetical protein RRY40_04325, partial [Oscillospiraceae bacterium]